jgi:Flp pilus assembly protein CpaB
MKVQISAGIAAFMMAWLLGLAWQWARSEPNAPLTAFQQQSLPGAANPVREQTVRVPVARQMIPVGTFLKTPEPFFLMKKFPAGQEPARALIDNKHIKDRRLFRTLEAGAPVTLMDLLPPETKAVTIAFEVTCVGGGFALPGCRVDVWGSTGVNHPLLAEDLLVLAVDMRGEEEELTLRMTSEDADILETASVCVPLRYRLRPQDNWKEEP